MTPIDFQLLRRADGRLACVVAMISLAALALALPTTAPARASTRVPSANAATTPPTTLTGTLMTPSPLGPLKRGTVVRSRTVGTRMFTNSRHGFALATERFGASYPAVTVNGGKTWKINGPVFHVPAAQAPFAVTQVGALNASTYFAWGAQSIDSTSDGGKHWWRTLVPNSALAVVPSGRTLIAVTEDAPPSGSPATVSVYLSTDGGHRWHITHELQGVG